MDGWWREEKGWKAASRRAMPRARVMEDGRDSHRRHRDARPDWAGGGGKAQGERKKGRTKKKRRIRNDFQPEIFQRIF